MPSQFTLGGEGVVDREGGGEGMTGVCWWMGETNRGWRSDGKGGGTQGGGELRGWGYSGGWGVLRGVGGTQGGGGYSGGGVYGGGGVYSREGVYSGEEPFRASAPRLGNRQGGRGNDAPFYLFKLLYSAKDKLDRLIIHVARS